MNSKHPQHKPEGLGKPVVPPPPPPRTHSEIDDMHEDERQSDAQAIGFLQEVIEGLRQGIERGGFQLGNCKLCGNAVVYLEEGLAPVCGDCIDE